MTMVIKIGGALLENPQLALTAIRAAMNGPTVIVHGGGVQISRMLERMNVPSQFLDGLRVTDETTLRAVCLALLGEVHADLVHTLQTAGLPAVGVLGSVRAQKKDGPWGLVGTNLEVDPEVVLAMLAIRRIPVIPTLALGTETMLNVNGDETAAAIAVRIRAARLIFMTDVPGVKDGAGSVIDTAPDVDELLGSTFVAGGMLPKLKAVKTALTGGVRFVRVGRTVFGET